MEKEKKIKTRFLSVPTLLKFLLLVSVCLFCVAIYVNSHPELLKKTTPTPEPTAAASTVEPTASALPAQLTDPNSVTVLVDKNHSLSRDFVPTNLATPYLQSTADVIQIRQDVGDAAKSMISAAEAAGIKLYVLLDTVLMMTNRHSTKTVLVSWVKKRLLIQQPKLVIVKIKQV